MAIAVDQHHGFKLFVRSQRCRLRSFTHLDYAMLELNQTTISCSLRQAFGVASIPRSSSTPCLSVAARLNEELNSTPRIEIIGGRGASKVHGLVVEVAIALAAGVHPAPLSSGLGGVYVLRSQSGYNIAVAKPIDEGPMAFNNPKGSTGRTLGQCGLKCSIRVGETGVRELAAYLLDHGEFAGVPATALVKIHHTPFNGGANATGPCKIASIQRFVDHEFDAGELGPSGFSVASVHRIGILDVRLLNLDRHAGNVLVKKQDQHKNYAIGAAELVPIDHGFCLPELLDDPYFEWLHWPQASVPFSETEIEYVSHLDPFKDAELLRSELPAVTESSIRVMVLCTIFLKRAVAAGLCLADIGEIMTREFQGGEEDSSALEKLCAEAKEICKSRIPDGYDGGDDGNDKDDLKNTGREEEMGMFQFDNEFERSPRDVFDLPGLLQIPLEIIKPLKTPSFSSSRPIDIFSSYEDLMEGNGRNGILTRSLSFPVQKHNNESGSISFGEMSEDEWLLFLDTFTKLLPEVFEFIKVTSGLKQRLGTSCSF